MLLAIDIGNTSTKLGIFKDNELLATWQIHTSIHQMADDYASVILNLLHHQGLEATDIKNIVLCSVVPQLVTTYEQIGQRYFQISPLVVGAGVKTGVSILMDNPREVGSDRIVDAAAALHLYGGPVIIVDLGTATTFDTVSEEGDYIGGAIAPGITSAAESLFTTTAMLPSVGLTRPERTIGTNTIAAMQSGLVFGYVGLVEGIINRIQKELGEKTKVVATGGYAELIAGETSVIDVVNPDLTLIGLRLIYLMNKA